MLAVGALKVVVLELETMKFRAKDFSTYLSLYQLGKNCLAIYCDGLAPDEASGNARGNLRTKHVTQSHVGRAISPRDIAAGGTR